MKLKHLLRTALAATTLMILSFGGWGQTTLTPGDIFVLGVNMDGPDGFSFVTFVDLEAGTVIRFTDSGVFASGAFRGGEGGINYTAASAVSAGTIIQCPDITSLTGEFSSGNDATVGTNSVNFSATGDQLIVFQGLSTSPTFIFALNMDGAWVPEASSSNNSTVPLGLVDGVTALAVIPEIDNAVYNMSTTSGTVSELKTAILSLSNWTTNDAAVLTLPSGSLTISGGADTTPPVATFSPLNAATDVAITITPTITFDEAIRNTDDSEITSGNVASLLTFTDPSKGAVGFTATIDGDKKVITVTPDVALTNEVVYTLSIAPVEDASDNATELQSASFTTISATAETIEMTSTPNAIYYAGDEVTVTWTSANITNVNIDAWIPSMSTWLTMDTKLATAGTSTFTIPTTAEYSALYKLRVVDAVDNDPVDESGTFTIISTPTINDIQSDNTLGASNYANDIVRTSGIITAIAANSKGYYLQDGVGAWNGIYVYYNVVIDNVVGQNVTIVGKVEEYNNLTEITTITSTVINSSGNPLPAAVELTSLAANAEDYESVLLKVTGATCASGASGNYVVNDGSGDLTVYKSIFTGLTLTVGVKYDIAGILGWYNTSSIYQLYPRSADDIQPYFAITFNVDMANAIAKGFFDPGTQSVYVVGDFTNAWADPILLTKVGESTIYTYTTDDIYKTGDALGEYKFRVGTDGWETGANLTYTVIAGDNTINSTFRTKEVGYANLQWPANGTIDLGGEFNTFAQVWIDGITGSGAAGSITGLSAWLGFNTTNATAVGDFETGWTWIPATMSTYDAGFGNNSQYQADIASANITEQGTYYYVSRFKYGNDAYLYGGFNSGYWDGTTNVSGVLTVNLTDAQKVAADKAALGYDDFTFNGIEDQTSVKSNFTLPVVGDVYSSDISWASDNTAISITGANATVTRPLPTKADAVVNLTATITNGAANDTKVMPVTVKEDLSIFDLALEASGDKTAGVPFNLSITNAKDADGAALSGDIIVTVDTDQASKAEVFNANATFVAGAATVTITLNTVASHTLTVGVTGVTIDETLPVNVIAAAEYSISLTADGSPVGATYDFGDVLDGYSPVTAETVTVTRTGTGDITNLAVALSGADAASFTKTDPLSTTLNEGSPTTTFTVKPNDGLAVGVYNATVTVTADNSVSEAFDITFEVIPVYAITIDAVVGGTATVTSTPATEAAATTVVTVNISNIEAGKQFKSITVTDADLGNVVTTQVTAGVEYTFVMPAKAVTVTVEVEAIPTYTVTFAVIGGNGTISATADAVSISSGDPVQQGKDIVFTASPDPGFRVKEWKADGSVIPGETSNTVSYSDLDKALNFTVEFEAIPTYAITVAAVVGGTATVTTDPATEAVEDATVTVSISAIEAGKQFSSIEVKGADNTIYSTIEVTPGASYTFVMPAQAVTVTVTLEDIPTGLLVEENFDYVLGTLLTANGYTAHSGGGTNSITVTAPTISYPYYFSSGIGNEISIVASGEDVHKTFSPQTTGTVYIGLLVNITSASTTGDYFFHLSTDPIAAQKGRLYVIKNVSNKIAFGICHSATPVYTDYNYDLNTTYLIALKYEFVDGADNDIVSLQINPVLGGLEPATGWIVSTDTPVELASIASYAFRQGTSGNLVNAKIDGLRIATTWEEAFKSLPDTDAPVPTFLPANSATDVAITFSPTITFNEAIRNINDSEITSANVDALITFKKTDVSGEDVAFDATIDVDKKVITIDPTADLLNNQVYYLAIAPVEDVSGNATTSQNASFTTISAAAETVEITSTHTGPYYAGDNVTVTWNYANITNVDIDLYVPASSSWVELAANVAAVDGTKQVNISAVLMYNASYKIRVTKASSETPADETPVFVVISTPSINDIQSNNTDGASNYDGHVVRTSGIVTAVRGNNFYIQDGAGIWNGVYVYNNAAHTYVQGDNVTVVGTVDEYNGLTEIVSPTVTKNSSGNALPAATVITTGSMAEVYEGVLVKVENVDVTVAPNGFDEFSVNDGSGACVVDDGIYNYTNPTLGRVYGSITGVVDYSFSAFKILPRSADDMVLLNNVATLSDLKVTSVTVAGFAPTTYTYTVTLPYGTTVTPTVTATTTDTNADAVVTPATNILSATAADRTTTVAVTAEDGVVTQNYTILFNVTPASTDATITSVVYTVDQTGLTITNVPSSETLNNFKSNLTPAAGATFEVYESNGTTVATTLATGHKVIATAEDGSTKKTYTITLNTVVSTEANILAYSILGVDGVISNENHTVAVSLPNGTNVTALVATFTLSGGASAKVSTTPQVSETTPNNFTSPVVYEVTAEDGSTKVNWTVTVTLEAVKHTVTFAVEGGNGTIQAKVDGAFIASGDEVEEGKDVVFTAIAAPNYVVKSWTVGETLQEGETGSTFTTTNLVADISVKVEFKLGGGGTGDDLIFVENFDYTAGSSLVDNGWVAHSGTDNPVLVVTPGLEFTGYIGSGVGNAAAVVNNYQDVNHTFTAQTAGTVYAAMIIKTGATNSAGYFLHLGEAEIPQDNIYFSRIWVNGTGDGIGVSGSTAPASYVSITAGTPYLVVLKYDFTSKVSSLYKFSSFPDAEPGTADATFTETATIDNVGAIALRQYNDAQDITVDGIRVAKTWIEAVNGTGAAEQPILTFTPANGATDVAINVNPTIAFSEAIRNINDSEITDGNVASLISLTKGGAENVAFSATINGTKDLITIVPTADLAKGSSFTLAMSPVEDTEGNATTLQGASFTTIPLSDDATLATFTLGGLNALTLQNVVVTDPVTDAGASLFVADYTSFAGIVATLTDANASRTVKVNGTAVIEGDLATKALANNDVILVTVVAEDETTTVYYKVTLTNTASAEAEIIAFSFAEQTGAATLGDGTIAIEVESGTDVSELIATFTLSDGASAKIGDVAQVSGTTPNNFTSPVTYVVTAENTTTTKNWVVTVSVAVVPETIFTETIGTVSATTAITAHETANGFDNDDFTMTSGGAANAADIRATNVSSGYTGASGAANVFFTSTEGERGFAIEGINVATYSDLKVQFAYRKESDTALPTFVLDYWNGTAYVNVPFTFSELATAAQGWYLSPEISLPTAAQIDGLKLKWIKSGSVSVRIDDIKLTGFQGADVSAPTVSFVPADAAIDVLVNVTPTITFNEAVRNIDDSAITNDNVASLITFTDPSKGAIAFTAAIDDAKKVITITPAAELAMDVSYTLTIAPVEDASNNATTQQSATFTTISATSPVIDLTSTHEGPYYAGDEVTVTWTSANLENVAVELYSPSTTAWAPVDVDAASIVATLGTYTFTIDPAAAFGTGYKLRVKNAAAETPVEETAAFTIRAVSDQLSVIRSMPADAEVKYTGTAVVTFTRTNRNQKYIQDASAAILIDDNSGVITSEYVAGSAMTGLVGKVTLYYGLVEFVPLADPGAAVSTGNAIVPFVTDLASLTSADQSKLVRIPSVTFAITGTFAANTNYDISDPSGSKATGVFRSSFSEADYIGQAIPEGALNAMVAIVGQYNTTIQLTSRSSADLIEAVADDATLSVFSIGGMNALSLNGVEVADPAVDAGASLYVEDFTDFAGIIATPNQGDAVVTVTLNGVEVAENDLATQAIAEGDVIVASVLAADEVTTKHYKVTTILGVQEYFTVTFVVVDELAAAITDAIVKFDGVTYDAGVYEFTDIASGSYDYDVTKDGYYRVSGTVTVVDQDVEVNITLVEGLVYNLPFAENFEDETADESWLPEGWVAVDNDGDTYNWYWGLLEGNGSMRSKSFETDALTPDNWLITPAIDLSTEEVAVKLSFKVAPTASTAAYRQEHYSVLISTTDDQIESFVSIYDETLSVDAVNWVYVEKIVDLTEYISDIAYIAFRHHDVTDMAQITLDEVNVYAEGDAVEVEPLANLSVYPNPFNSYVTISNASGVSRVVITNIVGQTVVDLKMNAVEGAINTSNLPKGIYLMSFYGKNGERVVHKMVKE